MKFDKYYDNTMDEILGEGTKWGSRTLSKDDSKEDVADFKKALADLKVFTADDEKKLAKTKDPEKKKRLESNIRLHKKSIARMEKQLADYNKK